MISSESIAEYAISEDGLDEVQPSEETQYFVLQTSFGAFALQS